MEIEIDQLRFSLNEKDLTASIIRSPKATGNVFIPRFIKHEGKQYKIIALKVNSFSENRIKSLTFDTNSEVTTFEGYTFLKTYITKLQIPANLKKIDDCCFENVYNLVDIEISPKNRNFIYKNNEFLLGKSQPKSDKFDLLYYARFDIQKAIIPAEVRILKTNSFRNHKVKSIIFPENSELKSIQDYAFSQSSIKKLVLPSKVDEIDGKNFDSTGSLVDVTVSPQNEFFYLAENKFLLKKSSKESQCFDLLVFCRRDVEKVVIPSYIKEISTNSFNYCKRLVSVRFEPNSSLQAINHSAFACCFFLKRIVFPESVNKIGNNAFFLISNLRSIKFLGKSIVMRMNCFSSCQKLEVIAFPNADRLIFGDKSINDVNDEMIIRVKHETQIMGSGSEDCMRHVRYYGDKDDYALDLKEVEDDEVKENSSIDADLFNEIVEEVEEEDEVFLSQEDKECEIDDEIIDEKQKGEDKKVIKFEEKKEEDKEIHCIENKAEEEIKNKYKNIKDEDKLEEETNNEFKNNEDENKLEEEINKEYKNIEDEDNLEEEISNEYKNIEDENKLKEENKDNVDIKSNDENEELHQIKPNPLNDLSNKEIKSPSDLLSNQENMEEIINECLKSKDAKKLMEFLNNLHDNEIVSQVFDRFYHNSPDFYSELCNEGIILNNCVAHYKYSVLLIFDSSNKELEASNQRENYEKAQFHLEESIRLGFNKSYFLLARLFHEVFNQDKKAAEIAMEGSKRGENLSKCLLGFFIANGIGMEKDMQKGISLMLESGAEDYYKRFATSIGLYYINLGDEKKMRQKPSDEAQFNESLYEYKEAFKWFNTAFEMRKSKVTINNLGICLLKGIGTKKNYEKAKEIFYFGIENGDSNSKYHIAFILEKTDPDESYKFYKEAAYEGNIYAQNKYAYIEKERNS